MVRRAILYRLLAGLVILLAIKVFVKTVSGLTDYFPLDFEAAFLRGRQADFDGIYPFPFYVHVVSAPIALLLMTMLVVGQRLRGPWKLTGRTHRRLGRVTGAIVLLLVAPSGFWMAFWAATGTIAMAGLMVHAILTFITMTLAVHHAIDGDHRSHQRWALRCWVLMLGPMVLRVVGGASDVLFENGYVSPTDVVYQTNVWLSWAIPLAVMWRHQARNVGNGNETIHEPPNDRPFAPEALT